MSRGFAVAAVLALAAAGCGSPATNHEASRPAAQVVADAERAALASRDFHLSGRTLDGTRPLHLDLWLARGRAKGRFVESGTAFEAVRIGGTIYVRGAAGSAWLRSSATNGRYASLASLLDRDALVRSALRQHGTIVNKGLRDRNGERTVEIRDVTEGGSLFVAATGTPYPVALVGRSTHSTLTFGDWDRPVRIAAPKRSSAG